MITFHYTQRRISRIWVYNQSHHQLSLPCPCPSSIQSMADLVGRQGAGSPTENSGLPICMWNSLWSLRKPYQNILVLNWFQWSLTWQVSGSGKECLRDILNILNKLNANSLPSLLSLCTRLRKGKNIKKKIQKHFFGGFVNLGRLRIISLVGL